MHTGGEAGRDKWRIKADHDNVAMIEPAAQKPWHHRRLP
jgi:hypothetical protein